MLTNLIEKINQHRLLIIIFSIGLIFRFIGILHGYPFIHNIDEPALVRSALGIRNSFWVNHFDWPHFSFYLNAIFFEIFIKMRGLVNSLGWNSTLEGIFPVLWDDPFVFYFLSRLQNSILYSLAVVPIYLTVKNLFSKKTALFASAIFLLMPYGIFISHFALLEPMLIFFVSVAIYLSLRAVKRGCYKSYAIAGIFWGIAVSVKYNAVMLSLLVFVFYFWQLYALQIENKYKEIPAFIKRLAIMYGVAILAFVITIPSVFKYPHIFWSYEPGRGLLWQIFENSQAVSVSEYPANFGNYISAYAQNIGYVPIILLVAGLVLLIVKIIGAKKKVIALSNEDKLAIGLYTVFIILFLYISRYGRAGPRYFIVLDVITVLLSAYFYHLVLSLTVLGDEYVQKMKSILTSLFPAFVLFILLPYSFEASTKFLIPVNISEAAKSIRNSDRIIYMRGSDVSTFNAINNNGYKRYNDSDEIDAGSLVVSEESLGEDKFRLIQTFELTPNLSKDIIYIYEKL